MNVRLTLIVARARNGVIGAGGKLPWRLRLDLQHFKRVTMGHPVIMGRKTWESLPIKPLPGRLNIVLSRDNALTLKGAVVVPTLDEAIELASEHAEDEAYDRVFVIGGDAIYRLALPQADEVIVSEIDADVAGDAHFPDLDPAQWSEVSAERIEPGEGDDHPFTIRTLRRCK